MANEGNLFHMCTVPCRDFVNECVDKGKNVPSHLAVILLAICTNFRICYF